MIPRLYKNNGFTTDSSGDILFVSPFVGMLSDALSCKVTQALDGEYTYTLEMTYPISGALIKNIACRMLIYAKPDSEHVAQYFEIYKITTPIDGVIKIYANHISYMLASIPVPAFPGEMSSSVSLNQIETSSSALVPHAFKLSVESGIGAGVGMNLQTPRSVRAALVGSEGSFIDTFSGEIEFDNFNVTIKKKLGKETSTKIKYGLNMTAFEQDENLTNVYTGIYPYAVNTITDPDTGATETSVVTIASKILYAEENPPYKKVKVVDLTDKFFENGITATITPATLLEAAQEYISENQWGVPSVNIKVSFVSLAQTEEYKSAVGVEEVLLGDTVTVEYPAVGITAKARCVKTVYDTLAERYDTIEVGRVKRTIVDTIREIKRDINKMRR